MKDPPLPLEEEKETVDIAPLGEPPDPPLPRGSSPPPLPPSVVSLRKMMFESYSKETDDAKMLVDDVNSRVVSSAKDLVNGTKIRLDKPLVEDTKSSVGDACTNNADISVDKAVADDTKISVGPTVDKDNTLTEDTKIIVDSTLWEDAKISVDNILMEDTKLSVDKAVVDDTKISVGSAVENKSQVENTLIEESKISEDKALLPDTKVSMEDSIVEDTMSSVDKALIKDTKVSMENSIVEDTKISEDKALVKDTKVSMENSIVEDAKSSVDKALLNDTKITVENTLGANTKTSGSHANESVNSVILEVIARMEDIVKEKEQITEAVNPILITTSPPSAGPNEYPEDLNPFGSDDEKGEPADTRRKPSLNPFGSDSDEEEKPPPRGRPLHQVRGAALSVYSLNPFSSDEEDDPQHPVPMPRRKHSPEPSPMPRNRLRASGRSIGSISSFSSYTYRKKKPAPQPPSTATSSATSTLRRRQKNRAPLPPTSPTLSGVVPIYPGKEEERTERREEVEETLSSPEKRLEEKLDDKVRPEKTEVLADKRKESEGELGVDEENITSVVQKIDDITSKIHAMFEDSKKKDEGMEAEPTPPPPPLPAVPPTRRRIVPLLVDHESDPDDIETAVPYSPLTPSPSASPPSLKHRKDSTNLQVQTIEGGTYSRNKSTYGQWKRKKGPAPTAPLPPEKRPFTSLSVGKLKQELEDIEVKQDGLERQGVALEEKIRHKFTTETTVTPYVEELVLQLFELVNEKNELFRRQAELMYLRRQYHLEEEHAELEYQIRCLMARPEPNKTDSDKELEELLIQRLVEVVEMRDSIVQCLERDRLREVEEDKSVNAQLNKFSAAMGTEAMEVERSPGLKLKKKKDKENATSKSGDLDKDVDEGEAPKQQQPSKKKKKWFSLHHIKPLKH